MNSKNEIEAFHAAYETLTGHVTTLDMGREHVWFDWLRYRAHQPFTQDDLRVVIMWIVKECKAGRRSLAFLRFNILIGQPDAFEEILNQIRAEQRAKDFRHTEARKLPARVAVEMNHSRHVSAVVHSGTIKSLVEQMRKEAR